MGTRNQKPECYAHIFHLKYNLENTHPKNTPFAAAEHNKPSGKHQEIYLYMYTTRRDSSWTKNPRQKNQTGTLKLKF